MKIIIATIKSWNLKNAEDFKQKNKKKYDVFIVSDENVLREVVGIIQPDYIFFPHWSWYIPDYIYEKYECVVFHETDLPFGRGGSPIQNMIVRGYNDTIISAIRVCKELDGGDVYLKRYLRLDGTIEDILIRSSNIIFNDMIPFIIDNSICPKQQVGEVVSFKRRKPDDGEIATLDNIEQVYDYIRMLDGEGYPRAFIKIGNKKFLFSKASINGNTIRAEVEIIFGD